MLKDIEAEQVAKLVKAYLEVPDGWTLEQSTSKELIWYENGNKRYGSIGRWGSAIEFSEPHSQTPPNIESSEDPPSLTIKAAKRFAESLSASLANIARNVEAEQPSYNGGIIYYYDDKQFISEDTGMIHCEVSEVKLANMPFILIEGENRMPQPIPPSTVHIKCFMDVFYRPLSTILPTTT